MRRFFLIAIAIFSSAASANSVSVSSPDGQIRFSFNDDKGYAQYTVHYNNVLVIRPSRLGFGFQHAKPLYRHLALSEVSRNSVNITWEQPWGEQRVIRDHHNELTVRFTDQKVKNNSFTVTVALQGEVGEFVVIARKEKQHRHYSGNGWYLGAITNEDARTITVPLDFLEQGKTFEAQIYQDGKKADWRTNPYDIAISKKTVSSADTLSIPLAEAGGVAIRFKAL